MLRILIVCAGAVCLLFHPVYAQEVQPPAPAQEAGVSDDGVTAEGNVSLDFRDADIQNVLRILSYKSGLNIVTGPEVTGLVTIKLKDVPWRQALEVILQTYGYAYEQKGNIITVTTIENMKKRREDAMVLSEQEPLVNKRFVLNYAKAADIIPSVEKMITNRGSVEFDERTNALIVRDIPSNIEEVEDIVEDLDATTDQVMIEAKIIETVLDDSETLGVDWVAKATVTGAQRPHSWPFTSHTANKYVDDDDFPGAEASSFSYGTLNLNQMSAVLNLLRTKTETNILSNPRIVTLDNSEASINVSVGFPIITKTYNEETGTWVLDAPEYKDIGIKLTVTPHVNNENMITLDIHPEVEELLEVITDPSSGTQYPKTSVKKAKTKVMIKDGETLVIGGLIKDNVIETKKKVPLLGDIPFLGTIFKSQTKSIEKTDLLIFLTPHIITSVSSK